MFSGCATMDKMTGKDEVMAEKEELAAEKDQVEKEKTELEEELETCRSAKNEAIGELNSMKNKMSLEKVKFEKELKKLKALVNNYKSNEKKYMAKIKELEIMNVKGEVIALFGGTINYKIANSAMRDYMAGLTFKGLNEPMFKDIKEKFQKKEGGDREILILLREIDSNNDKFINPTEATNFLSREETKSYSSPENMAK